MRSEARQALPLPRFVFDCLIQVKTDIAKFSFENVSSHICSSRKLFDFGYANNTELLSPDPSRLQISVVHSRNSLAIKNLFYIF